MNILATSTKQTFALAALTVLITLVAAFVPHIVYGELQSGLNQNLDFFSNSFSLWIAIGIGLIASVMIFRIANKIGGGVLKSVYNYFAIGLLLVAGASIIIVLPAWAPDFIVSRTHDMILILGFGVMAYGAKKLLTEAGLE